MSYSVSWCIIHVITISSALNSAMFSLVLVLSITKTNCLTDSKSNNIIYFRHIFLLDIAFEISVRHELSPLCRTASQNLRFWKTNGCLCALQMFLRGPLCINKTIKTLKLRQNGPHYTDIFNSYFFGDNCSILIQILLKIVREGLLIYKAIICPDKRLVLTRWPYSST